MKTRPILFSKPMILALLAGTKQQTRRLMPNQEWLQNAYSPIVSGTKIFNYSGEELVSQPRIEKGDRLWVKETVRAEERGDDGQDGVHYLADGEFTHIENTREAGDAWSALFSIYGKRGATCPSIFMPRWASRITLDVTDVRVERLNDISESDAIAEGIERREHGWRDYQDPKIVMLFAAGSYMSLWDSINKKAPWESNPWVAAYTFTLIKQNVDRIAA